MNINSWKIFDEENRGSLFPIEFSDLPFQPKRIFIIKDVPKNAQRGGHAHYETMQYLVCIKGEILVHLQYDASKWEEITLFENQSVLIKNMVWDWQKFKTDNDVLLVLCSTSFNKSDYIEDFDEFKKLQMF